MASSTQPQYHSMYLLSSQPSRPENPRQRSNSLPIGLAMMNAEEAGLLFSTAERATARRRRIASVDTPTWTDGPERAIQSPISQIEPSSNMIKPSPLRQVTQLRNSHSPEPSSNRRALSNLDPSQVNERCLSPTANLLMKSLPISPISPTKRQVPTPSLKTYSESLFQFTQRALVSRIPLSPPPQTPNLFEEELVLPKNNRTHSQRPSLESRFSDWSISTSDPSSRPISMVLTPPPLELDPVMMSPDSFFAGFEDTPKKSEFNRLKESNGYASSETYDPPTWQPTPIPGAVSVVESSTEEFSYFTNFDKYLDPQPTQCTQDPPESLEINLSPIESNRSPVTPSVLARTRAETVIRAPILSRSCSLGPSAVQYTQSTPVTPYQRADSIVMGNWAVGAVGWGQNTHYVQNRYRVHQSCYAGGFFSLNQSKFQPNILADCTSFSTFSTFSNPIYTIPFSTPKEDINLVHRFTQCSLWRTYAAKLFGL
jgi:hypothetical protein